MSISDSRKLVSQITEANHFLEERKSEEKGFGMVGEVMWKVVNALIWDLGKLCRGVPRLDLTLTGSVRSFQPSGEA